MKEWQKLFLRTGGVAAGVTVALAVVAVTLYWWSERPKAWSEKAVTAQTNGLEFQEAGEELHFKMTYAFTNETEKDYMLPRVDSASLMGKSGQTGVLSKIEGASWPIDFTIPAKQRVEVSFIVPYRFADFNTSAAELDGAPSGDGQLSQNLLDFVSRRLQNVNGLVFFDFSNRYRIVLPNPDASKSKKGN